VVPRGDPGQKWLAFLQNHREIIAALDFFTVTTVTFRVLFLRYRARTPQDSALQRYATSHSGMDRSTTAGSISGTLPISLRYPRSGPKVRRGGHDFLGGSRLRTETHQRAGAWQNGIAERWIGSCRREILDHVIALNEEHLRRLLRDYVNYHEQDRLHDSLEKDAPSRRAVEQRPGTNATVISLPRLGGLHHRYTWGQAA
jgi:hypothetical protein